MSWSKSVIFSILLLPIIVACSSTTNQKQVNLDEIPDIKSEQDDARYKAIQIAYRNVGKLISFYLNDSGSVEHICISDRCRQNYIKWRRSVHVDSAFRYSPSLQSFSQNHLSLCGKGNGKQLVKQQMQSTLIPSTYNQLNQLNAEIPSGNHDWNKLYNDQCYSDYLPGNSVNQVGEAVACAILLGICLFTDTPDIHRIVEFNPVKFKNDILRSGLDKLAAKMLPMRRELVRNSVEHVKLVSIDSDKLGDIIEQKANELTIYKAQYDGLMMVEQHSKELIGHVYFTQASKLGETLLQANLRKFEASMRNEKAQNDPIFIERLIPKVVPVPQFPKIPKLVKDEFEKIADFERRVELSAKKREQNIRNITKEYQLAVYKRNAYINALESAYYEYLDALAASRLASQKAIFDQKAQLSQLVMKLLYSDTKVTDLSYDAETERLHVSLVSPRNQFNQSAILEIAPSIAKRIKTEQNFEIGLNVKSTSNGVAVTSVNLFHDNKLYVGGFTDIKFEAVKMYVEVENVEPEFRIEKQKTLSKYIQKQESLQDVLADDSYNIYVRTKFNRRKPEWFEQQPEQDGFIYATGQSSNSREEAILDAKSTMAGFIQAEISAVTISKQAMEGNRLVEDFFEYSATSKTNIDLSNYDVKMIKDKEIDGWFHVLLKCKIDSI